MALVHHQVAISKHQEYIKTFTDIYSKRILDEINQSKNPKDVAEIKSDRIDYLYQISETKISSLISIPNMTRKPYKLKILRGMRNVKN